MTNKYNLDDIITELKKSNKIFWFDDNKNLLYAGNHKVESMKKMREMNINDGVVYRIVIDFHTGTKPGQGGKIASNIRQYIKEGHTLKNGDPKKNGIIWFDDKYIQRRGWKPTFINLLYDIFTRENFEFKFRIYVFHQLL